MPLNKQQQKAVKKTEGPCVILAGAGTGKSFTMVEKINHLANETKQYDPEEILCLTFSNEATNSLKNKIQERLKTPKNVNVHTFHGFCADVLREDGHLIKVDEGFEILLPDDAKVLMHKYLDISPYWCNRYITTIQSAKDFGITLEGIREYYEKVKENALALAKGNDIEGFEKKQRARLQTLHLKPNDTKEERKEIKDEKKQIKEFLQAYDEYEKFKGFIEAWEGYNKLKEDMNYLDFSDLNLLALQLFRQFGAGKYSETYKYLVVDEFQDTNKLQFELIEHIASHHNITVVGDPNQAIYGFRGAYKESFDNFKQVFKIKEDDVIFLDKSYRSRNKILNTSQELIKNNYEDPAECFSIKNAHGEEGDKVKVYELLSKEEEARCVAEQVEEAIAQGIPKEEICVLHRTHKQAELIKQALELKGISVITAGKTNLLQRREIRTAISYLAILSNIVERSGFGEQSWWDLFHYQNTLSPADSLKIGRFLKKYREQEISVDEAMLTMLEKVELSEHGKKVVQKIVSKLRTLVDSTNKTLPNLILDVYELTGLNRAFTSERSIENIEALLNLKKFYEIAENYNSVHGGKLADFINYIEIIDTLGVNVDASKIANVDAVRMMTIHAAKGLEFEHVIVTNMAQDRFPVTRTQNEPLIPKELLPDLKAEIESWGEIDDKEKQKRIKNYEKDVLLYEERRLCYVAWTRAKSNLILTYARSYNSEPDSAQESVFLQEINHRANENVELIQDDNENSSIIAPDSAYDKYRSLLKDQLIKSLDTERFEDIVERVMNYVVCREKNIPEFDFTKIKVNREELERHLSKCTENRSLLKFNPSEFTFSPTALLEYADCPKKFELSQLFQMPQRGEFDEGGAASTGSFVHKVCEDGVKQGLKSFDEYVTLAEQLSKDPEYKGIDLEDVKEMLHVFWERNKDKIGEESKPEIKLKAEIEGFRFFGLADRVDCFDDGTVEIVDYKTNKRPLDPKKRAWQLGYYALASKQLGFEPSKLTLDMLRLEKPVEMVIENGEVKGSGREKGFNLEEVKEELVETAKNIAHDFEHEFNVTEDDNKCRFCGYKFYCPKWDE